MKKVSFIVLLMLGLAFASCEKCQDCHYDDVNGDPVEIGELCDEDLEDAEADGYNTGDTVVTIHCEEH